MKAHEIFQRIEPQFGDEIIGYFRQSEKGVYRTTLGSLAVQKKLRPVFIQKKPAAAQISWIVNTLKLRSSDTVAEHLLQVWLLKAQREMVVEFLDSMGIEHDGEGSVDNLPETLDGEKLNPTVESLLAKHRPEVVTLYLQLFQRQTEKGWPELASLLENDERLKLQPSPQPS